MKEFSTKLCSIWKICRTIFLLRKTVVLHPTVKNSFSFFPQAELKEMSLMGTLTPPVEKKVKDGGGDGDGGVDGDGVDVDGDVVDGDGDGDGDHGGGNKCICSV